MPICTLSNQTSIYYRTYGKGKPVIVIHGFSVDHHLMTGCLEPIFKKNPGLKRFYLDLPGMGKTPASSHITNSDQMLEMAIDFIKAVAPNQQVVLIGESYGGYLAQGIIYRMPDLVDGLLLLCPLVEADAQKRILPKPQVLFKDDEFISRLPSGAAKEYFSSAQVVQTKETWQRFNDEVFVGLQVADDSYLSQIKKDFVFSFDIIKLSKAFNKPALMITGRQDSVVGYQDALPILENYPRMTFAVVDQAGHNLQIEQPRLFNALVQEWLDRLHL